jgi:hypothetical protein
VKNDVTYLAIIVGLFVLAFLLVAACDRIFGSDVAALEEHGGGRPEPTEAADDLEVAA